MILLVGCGSPAWTESTALTPHLARLDHDGDGRVTAHEYERTLYLGPSFTEADRDGDGELSAQELAHLLREQSPTTFDGEKGADTGSPAPVGWRPQAENAWLWELLVWLRDAPAAPVTDDAIHTAVDSGSLDSAETQAVLAAIRPAWEARGWVWPGLSAGAPE